MSERCEKTDLLADQCGHCRGHEEYPKVEVASSAISIEAQFTGRCVHCDEGYEAGESITHTPDGWALTKHTRRAG